MNLNPSSERDGAVRSRRLAVSLSQQRLAHLADCSTSSVALIERGFHSDRSAVLARILAALARAERVTD